MINFAREFEIIDAALQQQQQSPQHLLFVPLNETENDALN
jgi:hypothetical protein